MNKKVNVLFSDDFLTAVKTLRKKYRRVDADVDEFVDTLEAGSIEGDRLQGTEDYVVYKARLASRDMQRGKSGGFRVIYYLQTASQIILLIIYAKTEQADISSAEVMELIETVLESLEDSDDDEPNHE